MRVNCYAEELTERVEIIRKSTKEDGNFVGIRFYLELPISVPSGSGHRVTTRGPFIQKSGDDDSSAVTIYARDKETLAKLLQKALDQL